MPRPLLVLALFFNLSLSVLGQGTVDDFSCHLGHLGTLHFSASRTKLDRAAKDSLDIIAEKLKDNPECYVLVQAYDSYENFSDSLIWDRVIAVGDYLVKKQEISASRIVLRFDGPIQDARIITLDGINPDGLPTPAPHPKLHKRS